MDAELDLVKASRNVTLQVRVKRLYEFRVRIALALMLIKCAALIGNFNLKIETE